MFPC